MKPSRLETRFLDELLSDGGLRRCVVGPNVVMTDHDQLRSVVTSCLVPSAARTTESLGWEKDVIPCSRGSAAR